GRRTVYAPTFPDQPDVEVENSRGVGQRSDGFTLHGDSMVIDLIIECSAERDGIFAFVGSHSIRLLMARKPELHAIKEVEASPIDKLAADGVLFGAKEDCGGKDTLEALDDPTVVTAVFGHMEEIQHPRGTLETHDA